MHLHIFDSLSSRDVGTVLPSDRERALARPLSELVGTKRASLLLRKVGANGLENLDAKELSVAGGVPLALAKRIVAARFFAGTLREHPLHRAASADHLLAALPADYARFEREVLLGIALSGSFNVKAAVVLAVGGLTGTCAVPRDIFIPMIRAGAVMFALVHNHPSGDPTPSAEDIAMTKEVARGAEILGLHLVDHLVVATGGTVSVTDSGPGHRVA